MQFYDLEWDSKFFKMSVGKILFTSNDPVNNLNILLSEKSSYNLIYIFSEERIDDILENSKIKLVDIKVTYLLNLDNYLYSNVKFIDNNIHTCNKNYLDKDLEILAYQSGEFSRFKIDNNFKKNDFFRLYKTWIKNSIKRIICDDIFIYLDGEKIVGFVTVKYNKENSKIGLIAVDNNYRGFGIGSQLIYKIITEARMRGVNKIYVDTQKDNDKACRFYEKNSFEIFSIQYIYHYWNSHDKF